MIGERIKNYEITAKLGAGGMGEVYLATDTRLGRQVALKFLPREIASDPERRQRLELEAKAACSLDHPNILTIYEVDEHEGRPFIAMAYVEGADLKREMENGRLPLDQAVRYGLQIASGLGAAHAKGIVHRDVKPDNVLIGRDLRARLCDFGLAKLKESSGLTGQGTTVGTVGYMSPEQAQGLVVDARSDVFSLGVVLYELFSGKRPFVAEHAAAALYAIVHENPVPLTELDPEIPEPLAKVVERALAKSPADRYPDAAALEQDLRVVARELEFSRISSGTIPVQPPPRRGKWAWVAAGLLIIGIGLVMAVSPNIFRSGDGTVQAQGNTLAVMYFENLSDPEDKERLGDIITELLTTDLSGSEYVTVISTQRLHDLLRQEGLEQGRGITRDVASEIAGKAGASRMLSGTLSRLGGRTVITAQLIDVASGGVVGSERVDGGDVFTLVDDLSMRIKRKLGLTEYQVTAGDRPVAEATTTSRDAYREYLLGMDAYHAVDWARAHEHFDKALALDSTFALAYMRKGIAYFSDGDRERGLAMLDNARRHIDRVQGCDRLLVQAFAVDIGQSWNIEGALKTLKEATYKYPSHKEPFFWIANLYSENKRQTDSVLFYARRALDLDPQYPFALLAYASAQLRRDDYTGARETVARYLADRPNDVLPYSLLTEVFLKTHHLDSARFASLKAIEVAPEQRAGYMRLAQILVLQGQRDSAISVYENMSRIDHNPFTRLLANRQIASVLQTWGHFNQALEYLQRAVVIADSAGLRGQLANTYSLIGWMYYNLERYDDSYTWFERTAELDSLNIGGSLGMARINALKGDSGAVSDILTGLGERWSGRVDSTVMYSAAIEIKARFAFSAGRYQDALDAFNEARRVSGDSTSWRMSIAEALLENGQHDEAIAELRAFRSETERSWPSYSYLKALYLLARAQVESGHPQEAVEPLERFLVFWGDADWDVPLIQKAKNLYRSVTAQ